MWTLVSGPFVRTPFTEKRKVDNFVPLEGGIPVFKDPSNEHEILGSIDGIKGHFKMNGGYKKDDSPLLDAGFRSLARPLAVWLHPASAISLP